MAIPAKRGSFWRTGGGAFLVVAALCGGCSVLFHADATQCSSNADCTSRGTLFQGYTCHENTCQKPQCVTTSDCVAADAALASYQCENNTCVKPTPMAEAGVDAADASDASDGADADAGFRCTKNSDCPMTDPTHSEVACDVDTHSCLQLTTDDCQVVIGEYNNPSLPPPTFIGAYINSPGGLLTDPSYLNFLMALEEFTGPANGIPIGSSLNPLRTPVAIGCDVNGILANSASHLINDLKVPAIVSALNSDELSQLYLNYTSMAQSNGGVFVIDAFSDDPTLTTLQRPQGLLWHMLGQSSDSAPVYAAFVPMIEAYLRGPNAPQPLGSNPDGSMIPLKIAIVTSQSSALTSLSSAVGKILTWNGGKTISDNGANYLPVTVSDSTLNGSPTSTFQQSIDDAVTAIVGFEPNIVISFASAEFNQIMQGVQIEYPAVNHLPFYLLGPYNMGDPGIAATVQSTLPFNQKSVAGVGVASATDTSVLSGYESRFLAMYKGDTAALGYENYYDAMYFALYSLSYGHLPNPPSSYLATGMGKLINLNGTPYDVGPGDQSQIFSALSISNGSGIQLIGALGPPDFDITTGSRIGAGDVYCVETPTDGGAPSYDYDVLRLVNPDGGAPAGGGSAFTGSFPCYSGIQ
jgi:hypothetical protein